MELFQSKLYIEGRIEYNCEKNDKNKYIYDWRHEKRALKVKILHFEFLLQVASPIFSLSKNMKSLSLTRVLRFQ